MKTDFQPLHLTEATANGYRNVLAYWNDILLPAFNISPSLTKQSLYLMRLNILGFIIRAELNQPQLRWILDMGQPVAHVFTICTVYVGIPFVIGGVAP